MRVAVRDDDRRQNRRCALKGRGNLDRGDQGTFEVMVHDLSQTGIRFECLAELPIGAFVTVGLAVVGDKRARVAWRQQNSYGCEFTAPLRHQDVSRAIADTIRVSLDRSALPESLSMRIVPPRVLAFGGVAGAMALMVWLNAATLTPR